MADTSALYAIIMGEADAERYEQTIFTANACLVSAPTIFELRLVLLKKFGPGSLAPAINILDRLPIDVAPWTAEHVPVATEALIRFGGRPARLNFGDCLVYALAKSLDAPLLYKGEDFARTDIRSAL